MGKVNWVVVGIGDISRKRVIPAIQQEPSSTLYGVVTRNPEKAEPYGCRQWGSLEDALHDEAIDAVYVATPVALHAPQTIAALSASKHVLCEKPVALRYEDAKVMAAAARNAGRVLGVAYYRRTYPKVHRAMELLRSGAIGQPLLAEINCHDWFNNEDGLRSWFLDPRMAGGGPLYDIASHRIDLLNFFFGKPARVTGQRSNTVHGYGVEDSATVLIEYESGVRGVVDVRWNSRVSRDQFRIVGTEGEIVLSPLNSGTLVFPGGEEEIPPHANLHYPCVANFVDAVLHGAPLLSSGETAMVTDWVTEQVMRLGIPARYPGAESGAGGAS
ncbi:MAG: Gfo/Idh/MocA family oxidoreductase [Bryobacterales bacterium]|nr:Gfo/Idh/MocA family oxidoreductase [Bryobacterales bacterium]